MVDEVGDAWSHFFFCSPSIFRLFSVGKPEAPSMEPFPSTPFGRALAELLKQLKLEPYQKEVIFVEISIS